jgi:hypothetical protein
MANQLLSGLKRRYAETLGLAPTDPTLTEDLAHLAAVIRMFEPFADLTAIRAIRPYKPQRRRWSRTAMTILRKANAPMTSRELARRVMWASKIEPDRDTLVSIDCSLQAVLTRLERMDLVKATGKPRRWAIARD